MNIKEIKTPDDWQNFKSLAEEGNEIILFKYSPICPTSSYIEREFDAWIKKLNGGKVKIAKINVISAKSQSEKIAEELKIKHESPQVIWLDEKGKLKYHASHYNIDSNELNAHLQNKNN